VDAKSIFFPLKIERSVIHQSVCFFKDKAIGLLKITDGHHPWGQKCSPCIRKVLSGAYLIHCSLDIYIIFVFLVACIFKIIFFSSRLSSSLNRKDSRTLFIRIIHDPLIFLVTCKCCKSNCI